MGIKEAFKGEVSDALLLNAVGAALGGIGLGLIISKNFDVYQRAIIGALLLVLALIIGKVSMNRISNKSSAQKRKRGRK